MSALVLFPDVVAYLTGYLTTALADRPEPYATKAQVADRTPAAAQVPAYFVSVRRDGGTRRTAALEVARVAVNVWGPTDYDANQLARLVRALVWACPDGRPVCRVDEIAGPSEVDEESGQPRRVMW